MKALVLGGNGFIGSHVLDHLLVAGHSVRVFDRELERYRQPLPQVDYRIGAFDDTAALAEALEGMDVVYHFISTTVPSNSNKDPIFDIQSNLVGTVRLLNLMCELGVKRIVYLSSGGTVYGIPQISPVPENHPLNPICSYGVVKVAIENYLRMYQHLYGIEAVILRASNPYGERQGHGGVQGVIGTFMDKIIKGEPIEIWGDGSVVRDFIYVGDLAALCVLAGASDTSGTYNLGSGSGHSIKEIVSSIAMVSGKKVEPNYLPSRSYDIPSVVLDVGKVCSEFGWEANINFEQGLKKVWRWVVEYQ